MTKNPKDVTTDGDQKYLKLMNLYLAQFKYQLLGCERYKKESISMYRYLCYIAMFVCYVSTTSATSTPVIILIGSTGSGKSTQGEILSEALHIPHLSTGDLFRESLKKDTLLGALARKSLPYMDQGLLLPDGLVFEIMQERIREKDCQDGYILDGYPRTLAQAQAFDKELRRNHAIFAISLKVREETLLNRLADRIVCTVCQRNFNRLFAPPMQSGICDKCGGALLQRSDDTIDVIKKRLERFRIQGRAVLDYYNEQTVLTEVSGDESPEKVAEEILRVVRPYPRDYLSKHLRSHSIKNLDKVYDVLEVFKDVGAMKYIVDSFSEYITDRQADYIASSREGSMALVGALSYKLHMPSLFVRKAGKIPGAVQKVSFHAGSHKEMLELFQDENLHGKRVIIVDEGIANGATMLATIELLEKSGMKVVGCLCVASYHYRERLPGYVKWEPFTLTLFDL
jgi:adenylate kinase